MLTVSWIAPLVATMPPLQVLEELGRLGKINNVQVKTATGNVLLDDVSNILDTCADVLIWSGHGQPGGLLLSDGSLVRPKWLALHVARSCRPRVAILAACGTQQRDADLNSFSATLCRSGTNVVGFPLQASDKAAGTFIVEGIRSLALGGTVIEAFEVALDAIASDETAKGVFLTPGMHDASATLEAQLAEVISRLSAIEQLISSGGSSSSTGNTNLVSGDALGRTKAGEIPVRSMTRGAMSHIRSLVLHE